MIRKGDRTVRKLILAITMLVALATVQYVQAFAAISWTDDEGTFVLDIEHSNWSFGQMRGSLNSVEEADGLIYFEGSGEAGVSGWVAGSHGRVVIQTNSANMVVSGSVQ